jgi:hypothetical protein
MQKRTPFSNSPAKVIALTLVTVLALLVAPICAPLCAAKACSSATGQKQCHEMTSMGRDGGEQFVAASKSCGASDFSAVLVRANEGTVFLQGARNGTAPLHVRGAPPERFDSLPTTSEHLRVHGVPWQLADAVLLTTILRI